MNRDAMVTVTSVAGRFQEPRAGAGGGAGLWPLGGGPGARSGGPRGTA